MPLPCLGAFLVFTPARRAHNKPGCRVVVITIFGSGDGVFTAGATGGKQFSGFLLTDRAEIDRVDREIFMDNDIIGRIANFDFEPPLPPILCLNLGFWTTPKSKAHRS